MSTHPQRLGKYELQERLGHGGMAEVWKALDTQLQRYVAIKLLHANLKEDPYFIARFEREAQLIASLHHPNIVQIHDFQIASSEQEGTFAYMVMDYVEGQTLADYIRILRSEETFPLQQRLCNFYLDRPRRRLCSPTRDDSPRPQTRQYSTQCTKHCAQSYGRTNSDRLSLAR